VQFVYRHDAFLGPESVWAAQATECAADQQQFWAYHDQLFESQVAQHNVGNFAKPRLEGIAASLGLNSSEFNRCLESDRFGAFVQQASVQAQRRGIRRTPTLIVDGQPIQTPASFDEFTALLLEAR
jgi:protein-disulfide isomerase